MSECKIVVAKSPEAIHWQENTVRITHDFTHTSLLKYIVPGTRLYQRIHASTPILAAIQLTRNFKCVESVSFCYLQPHCNQQYFMTKR
ncbi:OrNV_orf138-like [Fopius arisanus]|nr:OrNV_orf138-like [Fopius arisanus]